MPGTLPFSNKTPIHSNNTSNKSNHSANCNTSEGELSPTTQNTSMSSFHEYSGFANDMHGQSSLLSQSQMTLNTMSTSINDFADTMSLNSVILPPELPKRSNSITSLPSNINCDAKPILSPRNSDSVTSALRSQPIISPKLLNSVNEEYTPPQSANLVNNNSDPPLISPRTHQADGAAPNFNRSPFHNSSHHRMPSGARNSSFGIYDEGASTSIAAAYPASPKHSNVASDVHDFGPMPISPHVNSDIFCIPPPPPPRRQKPDPSETPVRFAQIRQAPDAPELPPRGVSPPPVPPRLSLPHTTLKKSSNTYIDEGLREHSLKLPNTSTIMMRRNSALREGQANDGTSTNSTTANALPSTKSLDFGDVKSNVHHQNITSAPPVNRKPR